MHYSAYWWTGPLVVCILDHEGKVRLERTIPSERRCIDLKNRIRGVLKIFGVKTSCTRFTCWYAP